MAIKKRILRRPGKGSRTELSPALISKLAKPNDIETTVRLAARIGDPPPFDVLNDDKEGIAAGVAIMRKLWPLYCDRAVEYCVKRYGAGVRPVLWWDSKQRPYVRPCDWSLDGDYTRYKTERAPADLEYLREHELLTREEVVALAGSQKVFGPEDDE